MELPPSKQPTRLTGSSKSAVRIWAQVEEYVSTLPWGKSHLDPTFETQLRRNCFLNTIWGSSTVSASSDVAMSPSNPTLRLRNTDLV